MLGHKYLRMAAGYIEPCNSPTRDDRNGLRRRSKGSVEKSGRAAREIIAGKGDKTMRRIVNWNPNMKTPAFFLSILLTMLLSGIVSGQQKPTTGYAPVNGLKMYYEIHGSGEPVVLLHGAFMAISNNFHWTEWIGELFKTRKVIAIEMQGHGRTADIKRDFSYDYLADDVAALLDYLKIPSADVIGYSLGGGVALNCSIRHPDKVRKVVSISAVFRQDGWAKEALDVFPQLTAEAFNGTPIEADYKRLSPTPNEFPNFVKRVISVDLKPHDFRADKLKATKAPMFFIQDRKSVV